MESKGFVWEFLFAGSEAERLGGELGAELTMDERLEGWCGIPHGGVAMGAVAELASQMFITGGSSDLPYPFTADFRWGGSRLRTGDAVTVRITPRPDGLEATMTPRGGQTPYLTAGFLFSSSAPGGSGAPMLPDEPFSRLERDLSPLPYYRNCFVCGSMRSAPGLHRQFFLLDSVTVGRWAVAVAGMSAADWDSFFLFLDRRGMVHPLALLALLDETLGWGGFLLSAQGGVTVRLRYRFFRPVRPDEQVVVFGRGERVRGNSPSRMLFWAEGCAAVLGRGGLGVPVVTASGQWMVRPELTEQMKTELQPRAWVSAMFGKAG